MTCQVVYKYEINIDRTELIPVSAWDFVWSLGCSLAAATYSDRLVSAQYYYNIQKTHRVMYEKRQHYYRKELNICDLFF